MADKNPKVDGLIEKSGKWQRAMTELRRIVLDCGLTEEVKWGQPCYTLSDRNIVLIHGFKDYCALLLMKGALVPDPEGIMIQQTKNVQSGRQIRFTHVDEIIELEPILKRYLQAAIEVEISGKKVPMKATSEYPIPDEFQTRLDSMPALKKAFESLTPGRQRGYILHFSQPKQSSTRLSRIEKKMQRILDGKGLNDE